MGFNKGHELKKFEAHWAKLHIEYTAAGMSEDAIQQIFTASGRTTPQSCADGKVRFPHLHRLQWQVQKRRTADEILIFSGIPPIYTRGIRKPQMPLVTYQDHYIYDL